MNHEWRKWRKKPTVIEAVRWDGGNIGEVMSLGPMRGSVEWSRLFIDTPEGQMRADPGDWIIKGIKGEFYPCKPDIFMALHEPESSASSEECQAWCDANPEPRFVPREHGFMDGGTMTAGNDQPQSRKLPRWTTAWPEWFGIFGNVSVVPAEDYDRLLASIKSNLPSGMAEMVIESAGLPSSGSAAQAGDKFGTAPTAAASAVLSRNSTWKRDAIEWAQETIENGPSASIGEETAEALAQTILAYAASSETGPSVESVKLAQSVLRNVDDITNQTAAQAAECLAREVVRLSDVSRDSVIEDCAAVCDRLSGWEIQDTAASRNARSAFSHAARQIRALKRQSNSPSKDQP